MYRMKRVFVVLMILVTVAAMFSGCKKEPDLKLFCDWLSASGFTAGLGQTGFSNHISQYYYQGEPLKQTSEFYDVSGGKGYAVGTDVWKWTHENTENGTKINNHFAIKADLDGLALPGGVRMGDSLDSCMEKLGLEGKRSDVKDVKAGRGTCDLTCTDTLITFKEHYDWYNDAGKIVKVTRTLMFKFNSSGLIEFSVTVTEKA